jgi:hypothetical protein
VVLANFKYRLLVLETSLAQVRALLDDVLHSPHQSPGSQISTGRQKDANEVSSHAIISPPRTDMSSQHNEPLVADRNSRTAPMSLIRNMKHYILGAESELHSKDSSEDIVSKGIITEELVHTLLAG